jgi:D-aspartate ligase
MSGRTAPVERLPAAVVVELDNFIGLQSARILAARGAPVIGLAANPKHYCARTRAARRVIESPTSGEGLIRTLERLAPELPPPGIAYLVGCSDGAVLTLSQHRDRIPPAFRWVLPEHDVLTTLMDKAAFAQHALDHRLAVPPTVILRSLDDAERAARSLAFPAVLKPSIKTETWHRNAGAKVLPVAGPDELLGLYRRAVAWSPVLVVQSFIGGGEDGLYTPNLYFGRGGQMLVSFVNRKIRQWPIDTGYGCLAVETKNDTVLQVARDLFESLDYQGLAYAEIKRDERNDTYAIIEANIGRPTGHSAIAERGGVELLFTAYCDALGLPLPTAREQHYRGVKWIYWRKDLQAAAVRWRRGELSLGQWLDSVRGPSVEAVASLRDPGPLVAELAHVVQAATRALVGRVRARLLGLVKRPVAGA